MAFDDPLKRAMNEKAAQPAFLKVSLPIFAMDIGLKEFLKW